MEPTHVAVAQVLDKAESVVFTILVEIRMEATDNAGAEFFCRFTGSPAQRTFGSYINGLRVEILQSGKNTAVVGQAELKFWVARNR